MKNPVLASSVFLACLLGMVMHPAQAAELAITQISPDTGRNPADGITSTPALVLSGQADPGALVSIKADARLLGTVVAGDLVAGGGAWTFDLSSAALTNGLHVLSAGVGSGAGARAYTYTVMVDLAPPLAPTITAASPSTGTTTTGWTTSATSVVLSGRGEANAMISLTVDGQPLGTTTAPGPYAIVTSAGTWSLTVPALEGEHTLEVVAEDAAGNRSPVTTKTLTVARPLPPVITAMSVDSGSRNDDRITKDATPTFTGTAPANATVTVLVDGQVAGSVKAGSTGTWSLTTGVLADGQHAFTAVASFGDGLPSAPSAAFALQIKTLATAPSLAISPDTGMPADGVTSANALVFSGSAGDGVSMSVSLDSKVIGTPAVDPQGTWSLDWTGHPIDPGVHALVATATDIAGNQTAVALNIVIDRIAPAAPTGLAIEPPAPPVYAGQLVAVSGRAEPGQTIRIAIDGAQVDTALTGSDSTGRWVASVMFDVGQHAVTATAFDAAGNASGPSAPLAVDVEAAAPPPTVVPTPYDVMAFPDDIAGLVLVRGMSVNGLLVDVHVDGLRMATSQVDPTGSWNVQLQSLQPGVHRISAVARDLRTGLMSMYSPDVLVVIGGTAIPAPYQVRAVVDAASIVQVSGMAEPGATVEVLVAGLRMATATSDPLGAWQAQIPGLPVGTHAISARQFDPVSGMAGPASPAIQVTVGQPVVLLPPWNVRASGDAQSVLVTGQSQQAAHIEVWIDGSPMAETDSDELGEWRAQLGGFPAGDHLVMAREIDRLSGAAGPFSPAIPFTVAAPAPPSVINLTVRGDTLLPGQPIPLGSTLVINGQVPGQPTEVLIFIDGAQVGSRLAGPLGEWEWRGGNGLAAGVHTAMARTRNGGVLGVPSAPVAFQVVNTASVVSVSYVAEVSQVIDPAMVLRNDVLIGTPLSGQYRYQIGTADMDPSPSVGLYRFSEPGLGISAETAMLAFSSDPAATNFAITLRDNDAGDFHQMRSYSNTGLMKTSLLPMNVSDITWQLTDPSMRALTSDVLTGTPPDLALWPSATITIQGTGANQQPWTIIARIRQITLQPVQAGG